MKQLGELGAYGLQVPEVGIYLLLLFPDSVGPVTVRLLHTLTKLDFGFLKFSFDIFL